MIFDSSSEITETQFSDFLSDVKTNIDLFSDKELEEIQRTLGYIEHKSLVERAKTEFLAFVKLVAPHYKTSSHGQHHKMAQVFEEVVDGDMKRVTISMPPRFGKSSYGSIFLPAWYIGKNPDRKVMQISATEDLATDFGRKVKAIIDSQIFQEVFPGVKLTKDAKANSKFAINKGGEYFALGLESKQAGKGGDLIVVDDPTTEQEAKTGDTKVFEKAYDTFQSGPRQRLQPGGRIIVIQTRWSKADIIGRLRRAYAEDPSVDKYTSIDFPALDPETQQSTFPEVWPTAELQQTRANLLKSTPHFWYGPYQQNPTSSEGSVVPASLWKIWKKHKNLPGTDDVEFVPPECIYTIMVLDTAETENKRSNPTACTVWGLFEYVDPISKKSDTHIILLFSYNQKLEFHNLKREAKKWIEKWKPDSIIVEAKSTGPALRSELLEARIFTEPVRPKPGEDKRVRLAVASGAFHSGLVWYIPIAVNMETITQVADFPAGDADDLVDTVSYAIMRFRRGGFIKVQHDERDPDQPKLPDSNVYY